MSQKVILDNKALENIESPPFLCIGSTILYGTVSDNGPVSKTVLVDTYKYDLISTFFNGVKIPNGYHREYRVTFQGRTGASNNIYVSINNIPSEPLTTWSSEYYRNISSTPFFKESDIIYEKNFHDNPNVDGLRLYYWVDGSGHYTIYNITLHGYIVKN